MFRLYNEAILQAATTRSRILKNCQLYIKNAFWFAAWRWLYKEAETCRWYNLL